MQQYAAMQQYDERVRHLLEPLATIALPLLVLGCRSPQAPRALPSAPAVSQRGSSGTQTSGVGSHPSDQRVGLPAASARAARASETRAHMAGPFDPPIAEDLETGRAILDKHCGTCHNADRPTARPEALAVFSLTEADWSLKMTEEQLCSSARRIGRSRSVLPFDGQAFAQAVDRIMAHRGAIPCDRRESGS